MEGAAGLLVVARVEGEGAQGRRVPGFAQIADHLTQNSLFLPFFGEVVCTLGGTSLVSAARAGDAPIRRSSCHYNPKPPRSRVAQGARVQLQYQTTARSKLMPCGRSANNERSARPRAGLTSSDTTRQHHVSNSPVFHAHAGMTSGESVANLR